jgi:hypothetical protein
MNGRRLLAGLLLILAMPATALAQETITVAWDANTEPNVAGYVLFSGTKSGTYAASQDVGNVTQRTMTLPAGSYYFVVKAYNSSGQLSAASNEASVTIGSSTPPPPPPPPPPSQPNWEAIWQNSATGQVVGWHMANQNLVTSALIGTAAGWEVRVAADMDRDGETDLLLQNRTTGELKVWLLSGDTIRQAKALTPDRVSDPNWLLVAAADLNNDGKTDLVLHHQQTGVVVGWLMNGTTLSSGVALTPSVVDPAWKLVAAADLNNDGKVDLVWQHSTQRTIAAWLMNGTRMGAPGTFSTTGPTDLGWQIVAAGDANGDGAPDLLWQHTQGYIATWLMNGLTLVTPGSLNPGQVGGGWRLTAIR